MAETVQLRARCYDYQGKTQEHKSLVYGQRYRSPTTGKCKRLRVQSCVPADHREEHIIVSVKDCAPRMIQYAAELTASPPIDAKGLEVWLTMWPWFIFLTFWPFQRGAWKTYNEIWYKPYLNTYFGQLWAARSELEYSQHQAQLKNKGLISLSRVPGAPPPGSLEHILVALFPRQLIVYDGEDETWTACTDQSYLATAKYMAISYRQTDFPDRRILVDDVRVACLGLGLTAYWLDFECTGTTTAQKNHDLYRIADVFRGATTTLVVIRDTANGEIDDQTAWWSWGSRVWTFPEALLSQDIRYKVGRSEVTKINLRQLANIAFEDRKEAQILINMYAGKDYISRLELVLKLKEAIWKRNSGPGDTNLQGQRVVRHGGGSEFTGYPAERVYALMGVFPRRILPDDIETEEQALARLSMANDTDRIAERMVAVLPAQIPDRACWYSDEDVYGAKLWDIEPVVQTAGITLTGAIVLDGCRAAVIRWKDFPRVAFTTKPGFRRWMADKFVTGWLYNIMIGASIVTFEAAIGAIFLVLGIAGFLGAPFLVAYANSGRVRTTVPWLIGVKGVISAEEAELYVYGSRPFDDHPRKIEYSPTGSKLAIRGEGNTREGLPAKQKAEAERLAGHNVYTLVDTVSGNLCYFTAARPPTVCVFVAREGGLGRFILCSENCTVNELHKETVVRLPTLISDSMIPCNWLAVGTAPKGVEAIYDEVGLHKPLLKVVSIRDKEENENNSTNFFDF
jgi:hypothetical protein